MKIYINMFTVLMKIFIKLFMLKRMVYFVNSMYFTYHIDGALN